jgi:hypothetical protein
VSAPLVVTTTDGMVWLRRASTRGGLALYAPAAVCSCPEFVMATEAELAEHGIAGTADVLPVPVGPGPQEPKPIAYAKKVTEAQLLLAHPSEKQRAAEWPWDMWCRICLIRPTSHRTEADALEAADQHVKLYHAPAAEVHRLMSAGGLAELERLRARVADLEATLRTLNTQRGDVAQLIERERGHGEDCVDIDDLTAALVLGSDELAGAGER